MILLVTIPTADRRFEVFVRDAFDDRSTPATLQLALRARFPDAVVRPRILSDEQFRVWYVYRDGGWRPEPIVDDSPHA